MVVPVGGKSAFDIYKSYNPTYPHSEKYWVEVDQKGEKGDGVSIKGSVPTYQDLLSLPNLQNGDTYIVDTNGKMYVYGEFGFPLEGDGIEIKGEKGDKGVDGVNGVTPRFRGNSTTKTWEVSYDNGVTWIDTGTPYSGSDGDTFIPEFSDDYFDTV